MEQGRNCQLDTYNAYRDLVKLGKRKNFSQVSKNPDVVKFLRSAYKSVDDVEFYVGLFAEDVDNNQILPELLLRMVAIDAFSLALTNPLLSEHVWNRKEIFTDEGLRIINATNSLRQLLERNVKNPLDEDVFVGMTQQGSNRN